MDIDAGFAALDQGFKLYTSAGVDFFELNESCPNTPEENLEFSKIMKRSSHLLRDLVPPVLLKLSVDMDPKLLPETLELVMSSGFRGVVLGNTSTAEGVGLDSWSLLALRAFRLRAGGGLSGRAIAPQSRELLKLAQAWRLKNGIDRNRFALVSCGGILTEEDLRDRLELGADLCQMYTGLFV
jgi:dihydroorotate dehydrogenase